MHNHGLEQVTLRCQQIGECWVVLFAGVAMSIVYFLCEAASSQMTVAMDILSEHGFVEVTPHQFY